MSAAEKHARIARTSFSAYFSKLHEAMTARRPDPHCDLAAGRCAWLSGMFSGRTHFACVVIASLILDHEFLHFLQKPNAPEIAKQTYSFIL